MKASILEPIWLLVLGVAALAAAIAWAFTDALGVFLLGWLRVAGRAAPRIELNLARVATGVVCIAAIVVGLHYFAAWLYGEIRVKQARVDWPASWRWRWTLCLVAAVMLMFVAGLVGVGLFRTTSWFLETPVIFTKTLSFS